MDVEPGRRVSMSWRTRPPTGAAGCAASVTLGGIDEAERPSFTENRHGRNVKPKSVLLAIRPGGLAICPEACDTDLDLAMTGMS